MHIVLVYRYYNDGIVYYNLTFCTRKSLMTDLGSWKIPKKPGMISLQRRCKKHHQNQVFSIKGAYF